MTYTTAALGYATFIGLANLATAIHGMWTDPTRPSLAYLATWAALVALLGGMVAGNA